MEIAAYYDEENKVVVVASENEGPVTTELVKRATALAMQIAQEHHCDLLLFDISNMREAQSIVQGFTDMSDIGKTTGLTFRFKCAVVYNPSKYSTSRAVFIEAVVTNRPNPIFKMFKTRDDAMEWLKES